MVSNSVPTLAFGKPAESQPVYLSVTQLAERFGVNKSTVWRWSQTDTTFPSPVKLGAQVTRWEFSEIKTWELRRAVEGGANG